MGRVMGEDKQDLVDLRPQAERPQLPSEGNGEPWKGSKQGAALEPEGRDWRSEEVGCWCREK